MNKLIRLSHEFYRLAAGRFVLTGPGVSEEKEDDETLFSPLLKKHDPRSGLEIKNSQRVERILKKCFEIRNLISKNLKSEKEYIKKLSWSVVKNISKTIELILRYIDLRKSHTFIDNVLFSELEENETELLKDYNKMDLNFNDFAEVLVQFDELMSDYSDFVSSQSAFNKRDFGI